MEKIWRGDCDVEREKVAARRRVTLKKRQALLVALEAMSVLNITERKAELDARGSAQLSQGGRQVKNMRGNRS